MSRVDECLHNKLWKPARIDLCLVASYIPLCKEKTKTETLMKKAEEVTATVSFVSFYLLHVMQDSDVCRENGDGPDILSSSPM